MKTKSRLKLFLENFLFYGGLSMLTKALPFITLPIITRLLANASAYGIADMFNLINSFGTAIAVLGMYDAIFREFFEDRENNNYQIKVTSTGLIIVLGSSIVMILLTLLFNKYITILLFENLKYQGLVSLSAFAIGIAGISTIVAAPTRMRNNRRVYLYTGVFFPILGFLATYSLIKLNYTYEAIVYSNLGVSLTSLITFYILNKRDFEFKSFDKKIMKELFKIGLPLLPTFLIYWVYNSMDRVMINRMLGPTELGIYSVGAKVASVSQLVYTAFAGGWQYFAFSTMKDDDQVELNSKVFEYLGIVSFCLFIIAQPFIKPVFNLFFTGEYIKGSEVFSYLFLSPLMLMLFQIIANQVIVIKKSYLSTVALSIGAVLNIGLNYILIRNSGISGAALSTLLSYIISILFMSCICYRYRLIKLKMRFIIISLLMTIGILSNYFLNINSLYLYAFNLLAIVSVYIQDVLKINKRQVK
ncbi:MAG: oligosaccharide flippase family protein [Cetobacterium sp.]|uniref:oligosaccharide flippase family protein n=1 Tax=Cetobacterium sp. TaxID=2071632 RepID=UPI003F3BD2CC